MATLTGNYPCDNSTLANFKSWAQAISTAFSTFGWVQTADTGQVNWSTISSVSAVYEIWKANDSFASTLPIYIKIQYGNGTGYPQLQVTVGTGSNGTGTITGNIITGAPWVINSLNQNQGSTLYPCWFSGSAGEFRMWMWGTTAGNPAIGNLLVIERSKDGSGNNTADYFTVLTANQYYYGNGPNQQSISNSGVSNRDYGFICPTLTNGSNTGYAFGSVAALPVFPMVGYVGNPMLGIMAISFQDAAPNSIVTVTSMYGSTHTYLAINGQAGGNNGSGLNNAFALRAQSGANMAGLMRYE